MSKITHVIKRSGDCVSFKPERITNAIYRAAVAVGGRDRNIAEGLSKQVVEMLEKQCLPGSKPNIEQIQDIVEKVLIENGHSRVAKAYILYREEQDRRRRERAAHASYPSENIPWAKIWHVLDWSVSHGVNTIAGLNERIARDELPDLVQEAETAYEIDIENVVEMIAGRADVLKMVIITGPSSSGKTTTTFKISQRLEAMGLRLKTLNVDNYFFDLELHPKDEFGDYDFETPQALDLPLINEHIHKLIKGEEVMIPFYDFKSGVRHENQTKMSLEGDEIILIDSLHGLYADMTEGVSLAKQFRVYLEPLLQMKDDDGNYVRWADLRLIRRMLRDAAHRAYDPARTLKHWHYVRSSELRNIIPYVSTTDYIINSSFPYEMSIYRPKLMQDFAGWVEKYRDDPLREDAFTRADRVHDLMKCVTPIEDDSLIPVDSVLREFIGGSCFDQ